jgi:hypothetical protein
MPDEEGKRACIECVGDPILVAWISESGDDRPCSYGHSPSRSVDLVSLADRVDPIYLTYHQPGEWIMVPVPEELGDHDYRQLGDNPDDILTEMLEAEGEVVEDLLAAMASLHPYDPGDASESMYEQDWNYQFVLPASLVSHQETWDEFADRSRHTRRFFDSAAMESLAQILGSADSGPSPDLILRSFKPTDEAVFYRARMARDQKEAVRYLGRPSTELNPPPPVLATSGRMNPPGIPVFYGAFAEETCIGELRPWVGGRVVTAGFSVRREIQLLDLAAQDWEAPAGTLSFFAEDFAERLVHRRFLGDFEEIVSRPVQPHESEIEFVPTQMVAEYVRDILKLDGIVYRSSQLPDAAPNVVLFTRTSEEPATSLVSESVTVWMVEEASYESSPDEELEFKDLAEGIQRFVQLTNDWNATSLIFAATLTDEDLPHEVRVSRLWGVFKRQLAVVAMMNLLGSLSKDDEFDQRIKPIVSNYRARFDALGELVRAVTSQDVDMIETAGAKYQAVSAPEVLRPLVGQFFEHPKSELLLEGLGFTTHDLLDSILGEEE